MKVGEEVRVEEDLVELGLTEVGIVRTLLGDVEDQLPELLVVGTDGGHSNTRYRLVHYARKPYAARKRLLRPFRASGVVDLGYLALKRQALCLCPFGAA